MAGFSAEADLLAPCTHQQPPHAATMSINVPVSLLTASFAAAANSTPSHASTTRTSIPVRLLAHFDIGQSWCVRHSSDPSDAVTIRTVVSATGVSHFRAQSCWRVVQLQDRAKAKQVGRTRAQLEVVGVATLGTQRVVTFVSPGGYSLLEVAWHSYMTYHLSAAI